jgi:hypothetical protein
LGLDPKRGPLKEENRRPARSLIPKGLGLVKFIGKVIEWDLVKVLFAFFGFKISLFFFSFRWNTFQVDVTEFSGPAFFPVDPIVAWGFLVHGFPSF